MNLSEILRYAFLGTVVYGAYKLGEKNGKNENVNGGFATKETSVSFFF